ncbi:Xaa-Pro peptidase family protein [Mesorhizobium sp.]|uniref:M24 family metallopeptidase n=1 Tax=Mesorhizobium sp. TaxID=1871066 RepID=UPI000FE39980|nr:Xaa-Pro peptidase family protein [Mesorhizobium sp.]RWD74481.1 MAG: aminopeptidase P family protein [Mesorhizobium sp.]RWH67681.1 MAG: aminopeptidase P family protein [Mesorhizobium sp.]RWK28864.1 MAG: aminopeptidase P family protein [Mesorhizobium sp.]RWL23457.1 MAG: aminopeptidase P family protein [Mesorhizobium sp.]RWL25255.1 MAG: aminopeptidase P family protein [Mesorhizobium sp.]
MKVSGIDTIKVEKDLAFTIQEYQRRLKAVREGIAARDLDILVVTIPENMLYLSGYNTLGYASAQYLLIPLQGEPLHITRGIEEVNVRAYSWIDNSTSYMDHEAPLELLAETLRNLGFAKAKVGFEKKSWFFSIADYEALKTLLPDVRFEDGSMIVEAVRVVKSDAEIDYIRQAARIAEAGIEAGINQIRAGVNENEIAAEIQRVVTLKGSEYPGYPPFVTSGVRTSYAHGTWSGRQIQPGDPVFLELSGTVRRYSAAIMRASVVSPSNRELEKMEDVSRRALENMLDGIRPDRPLGEVWSIWSQTVNDGGYEGRFKRTGYSIGISYPPDWGEGHILSFKRGETRILKPNMVFHIPSMVKAFGFADVGTSETVRVTETGCEILTNYKRQLYVR